MLHACAQKIVQEYGEVFPRTQRELTALPGIGPYTAGAIMAFAFNEAVPIIETNIRTVFIHHFFHDDMDIPDSKIVQLTVLFLDHKNPRVWYWALMDYGAYLKKTIGNQNVRSKHYTKQSTFKNSDRQIRGMILRLLIKRNMTRKNFKTVLPFDLQRIES
jgi:A/G-specific adenine glycosylase